MAACTLCSKRSPLVSEALKVCLDCIRQSPAKSLAIARIVHRQSRMEFNLPLDPPKDPDGQSCNLCVNQCKIAVGQRGYCGLRINLNRKIMGVTSDSGNLSWYHDPLPTNCVADWVCPGGTGAGYPQFAHCNKAERGYDNLAVFFQGCSFNCLYCQNWHFKQRSLDLPDTSPDDLVSDIGEKTACICFFGGDPSPQLPFSLRTIKLAKRKKQGQIFRSCWETNGSMNSTLLYRMMEEAIASGGCVKFDLKAWSEPLHIALTGISNKRTLSNFKRAARKIPQRPSPPPLLAATLMVPGYIDDKEVAQIAQYIASIDATIPYSLLAFHPQFYMSDLPVTSKALAYNCLEAAQSSGLKKARIGNAHLLDATLY